MRWTSGSSSRPTSRPLGFAPALPHAISLGSTTTILATVRAGGGIGVISSRAAASALAAGELVELRVEGLSLTRPLHALWLGRTPSVPAAELTVAAGPVPAR